MRRGYQRASARPAVAATLHPVLERLPPVGERRLAVRVTADALRQIRGRHPWVYERSMTSINHQGAAGDLAIVFDNKRKTAIADSCTQQHPTLFGLAGGAARFGGFNAVHRRVAHKLYKHVFDCLAMIWRNQLRAKTCGI